VGAQTFDPKPKFSVSIIFTFWIELDKGIEFFWEVIRKREEFFEAFREGKRIVARERRNER
jgi:hypothetical protein